MLLLNSKTICEYIWIGGKGEIRSKTRVINDINKPVPEWNYDGSSTGQADSNANTEVILKPCAIFNNPLRKIDNYDSVLVLCDTYNTDGIPLPTNNRNTAVKLFNEKLDEEPWFGLEQEYFFDFFITNDDLSFTEGLHYCGSANNDAERTIVEEHLAACLDAGLTISGINSEVSDAQWEFQIGPCEGIMAGDHLYVARYLLERISEKYNASLNYHPKPLANINGSGCHVNFSTQSMRNPGGLDVIKSCMPKLERKHNEHIEVYGKDNVLRLTGKHETSSYTAFNYGVGTRNTSVRIPNQTVKDGCGYFEDRRPAANIDPYQATSIVFKTCCLDN